MMVSKLNVNKPVKIYRVYTNEWCGFKSFHYLNRTILLCIPCISIKWHFSAVKLFPAHAMKTYRGSRGITPFLTSALDGSEWLTSRPHRLIPRKEPRYPLNMRLDGPQSRYGRFGEEKNLLPHPGFESRTVQPRIESYRLRYPGSSCGVPRSVLPPDNGKYQYYGIVEGDIMWFGRQTAVSDRPVGTYLSNYTVLTQG